MRDVDAFGALGLAGLFGFQDEAAAFVEVDAAVGVGAGDGGAFDGAFEDVVVVFGVGGGGVGAGDADRVAEFGEEEGV